MLVVMASAQSPGQSAGPPPSQRTYVRINHIGYLPEAAFNTGFIVYHDDVGDYSTNEPIMDGTANPTYLFAAMAGSR